MKMSSNLSREFLVQRLVNDARNREKQRTPAVALSVGSNSDGEEPHSDSSSDPGGGPEEKCPGNSDPFPVGMNPRLPPPFMQNPLQYAATLASLAQMNFLQPGAAANTLPLLYPHLYQSLLTFPNLEQLRLALQSPKPAETSSKISLPTPECRTSFLSPENVSPSPRKRPSTQKPPAKSDNAIASSPLKKPRAIKRLQFDDETSSPVSGMYIKDAEDLPPAAQLQAEADLDDSAKYVEITEEAKAEIAKIPNLIGDYVCCLCKVKYDDPFKLAQHRCPRIVHEEYRCPECDKVFSCPANLASHRRWHKPRESPGSRRNNVSANQQLSPISVNPDQQQPINLSKDDHVEFRCEICQKMFESHRILRSHAATAHTEFGTMNAVLSENYCGISKNCDAKETKCEEFGCDLWFPTSAAAEKHVKSAHPKFPCKFCSESFPTSPSLTRHINKHHPTNECKVVLLEELKKAVKNHENSS